MDIFRLEPIVAELERVFAQLKMKRHQEKLAKFKAGYRTQLQRLESLPDKPFTSETVIELAAVFQVPPFADRYAIAPNDNRCPWCRADLAGRNAAPVCGVYADRTLYECRLCSKRFLRIKK